MKPVVNSLRLATQLSPEISALTFSYLLIPVVVLAGFGLYLIFTHGYLLPFVVTLAIASLFPLLFILLRKKPKAFPVDASEISESLVEPSADWGSGDTKIWNALNVQISELLKETSNWEDLQDHALTVISLTATEYEKKQLSFSIPELLVLSEELSKRYREVLLKHVPSIEHLHCSLLKSAYDHQHTIKKGASISKGLYNLYRSYRIFSPTGLISELKEQFQSRAFASVSEGLMLKLKRALLQEVATVAIDLYSGRFKLDQQDLSRLQSTPSHAEQEDNQRFADPLAPLRVCVIGQVSAGKSSVINALIKGSTTEIDSLPSTKEATVYQCAFEGCELMHLVDLPGLDGNPETEKAIMNQTVNAHVILWVLKANQPAKTLDSSFKAAFDTYYTKSENRSRKPPVIIGVLNQVDRLKPVHEWKPPYDLENDASEKAIIIRDALNYNKNLLNLATLIPLSVSENRPHYNLDELKYMLDQHYQKGIQVQMNLRRNQAIRERHLSEQLQRLYQSGKSLFHLIRR